MDKFPLVKVSGSPWERGYQHGSSMPDRIVRTIDFYKGVFGLEEEEIFRRAQHYKAVIIEFNQDYSTEIEGIAEGAGVDPLWIYALNARSEILTMVVSECSALYSSRHGLLAQTWDWAEQLEYLALVVKIEDRNHTVITMTEPGILAKIGMNSSGIGATINFLHLEQKLDGVPIHIILRSILDTSSLAEVEHVVEKAKGGQAGNIIVGTKYGEMINFEFAGDNLFQTSGDSNMFHTNHYLSQDNLNTRPDKLESSRSRYLRLGQLVPGNALDVDDIYSILTDTEFDLPICRPYVDDVDLGNTGTICAVIMDLKNGEFKLTPGNPKKNSFVSYKI